MKVKELRALLEWCSDDATVIAWGRDGSPVIVDSVSVNGVCGPPTPERWSEKLRFFLPGVSSFVSLQ